MPLLGTTIRLEAQLRRSKDSGCLDISRGLRNVAVTPLADLELEADR
jgi:hypothetical protein